MTRINVLDAGKELSLAVEGSDTNLIIWTRRTQVFMRLDRYQQYSAHLSMHSASYLEESNPIIDKLVNIGSPASIDNLWDILALVYDMEERECKYW